MKKGFYYGVEASEYGKESGYVDYGTLQEIVRGIPGTNIVEKTEGVIGNWELISGDMFYYSDGIRTYTRKEAMERKDEYLKEDGEARIISQYLIISESKARFLMQESDELIFYNDELNMYVWGITFCGMLWTGVLTHIPLP